MKYDYETDKYKQLQKEMAQLRSMNGQNNNDLNEQIITGLKD